MRRLGELERQVMTAIMQLHGEGYVVTIADELQQRFQKKVSLGAIYSTVDRLEGKGFITSRLGSPTAERGGKPKRFYQIAAPGRSALAEARAADNRFWTEMSEGGIIA